MGLNFAGNVAVDSRANRPPSGGKFTGNGTLSVGVARELPANPPPHLPVKVEDENSRANAGAFQGHFRGISPDLSKTKRVYEDLPVTKGVKMPLSLPAENNAGNVAKNTRAMWSNFERYEVEYIPIARDKKNGHHVVIRKRLIWDSKRPSYTIARKQCERLTEKMAHDLKIGKYSRAATEALTLGGVNDDIIREIKERPGRGNGLRHSAATEEERARSLFIRERYWASIGSRTDI